MFGSLRNLPLVERVRCRVRRLRKGRGVWCSAERVHIELRELRPADTGETCVALEQAIASVPEVAWARVNRELGRIVVALHRTPGTIDDILIDKLLARIDAVEHERSLASQPFSKKRPERYPGALEPLARSVAELGISGLSLCASVGRRVIGVKTTGIQLHLAALVAAAEAIPEVRKPIERAFSIAGTELGFEVARSLAQALISSTFGLTTSLVHRGLRLRELLVRRRAWRAWESELCACPEHHAPPAGDIPPRPVRRPRGPIEQHTHKAVLASLGAFGTGLAFTGSRQNAVGAIFAGLPRPASLGREAFATELGVRLTRADLLIMEPHELRHLDRVDTVVLAADAALFANDNSAAQSLDALARRAGVRVVLASPDAEPDTSTGGAPAPVVPGGEHLVASIRKLQGDGAYVCLIAVGPSPAYRAADLAIGLLSPGQAPPWGAHLIGRRGARDMVILLEAIAAAKQASKRGIQFSLGAVGIALGLAMTGLRLQTTRRIMASASITTLLSMGAGVRVARSVKVAELAPEIERKPWHNMPMDAALAELGSSRSGLPTAEAQSRRREEAKPPPRAFILARLMASELMNPMTPILLGGAGLAALVGHPTDAGLVVLVLGANAIFGAVQRYRTECAVAALEDDKKPPIRVMRDDREVQLDVPALVPGDVIRLDAGDVVPADCRVIESRAVEVDESSLTGESVPVAKTSDPVDAAAVADRTSMLYEGTHITAGAAIALVVAVGSDTEARRALLADERPPPSGVETRLKDVTAATIPLAVVGCAAVVGSNLVRGRPLRQAIATAVSLAIAAVPEGLPLLASVAQLAAARRLSQAGALVRNPRAVEALGRVNVLCADKTGTLTEGRIRLHSVSNGEVEQPADTLDDAHRAVLAAALRATPTSENGELAHMTDRAVAEGGRHAEVESHRNLNGWRRLEELPFEPTRGFHAGLGEHEGGALLSVKGAPEVVLPRCTSWHIAGQFRPLSDAERDHLKEKAIELARKGLRVLAVAEREDARPQAPADPLANGSIEDGHVHGLAFLGFVGLADPVRGTARAALEDLHRAGVAVIMLTGDHPSTAESIATELGLRQGKRVVSGHELDAMSDEALGELIPQVSVFARVTPLQKVRIVRSLQRLGRVVAMTGDGANDAPAIRLANVGIALGERATSAARHSADMVVTDERIETIVHAVLQGRALWTSVRDAVAILVGGNFGEIAFAAIGGVLLGDSPLSARQLLLVNLLTDSLPSLAIALQPPPHKTPEELLREGPEVSLGAQLTRDVAWRGVLTAMAAGSAYLSARGMGNPAQASTVSLLALTGAQLGQTLAVRGAGKVVWATGLGTLATLLGVIQMPGLSQFFGCMPLGPLGLLQAGAASAAATAAARMAPRLLARYGFGSTQQPRAVPAPAAGG